MAWTNRQKGIVKMYARYAGVLDQEYRQLLLRHTVGADQRRPSSTNPRLSQQDFDYFMVIMETRAHLAEENGMTVGRKPKRILSWHHWRDRCPAPGMIDSRQRYILNDFWQKLLPFLSPEQRGPRHEGDSKYWYLHAIAAHALRHPVSSIAKLKRWEAAVLTVALDDKLKHAHKATA